MTILDSRKTIDQNYCRRKRLYRSGVWFGDVVGEALYREVHDTQRNPVRMIRQYRLITSTIYRRSLRYRNSQNLEIMEKTKHFSLN